ncbi:hypothetical protein MT1_3155 [Pseudomonas sp. MT-1]|uniref:hypothetical protein n=1 Tax=Stutzerimonas stutzeri TaxID=316 RepID=UPI000535AFF4|nr:hypothetical protein [Stutzerimonas stutzeri]MCQ4282895.1 hypothetical protein [Stutzerimonas stutzeri]BAP80330.1 hypothetical protein MT1_3155 [Pseudomonas sp. MT-1]|tara:strand:+ start:2244 stop:2594 length:351 start_codon:yes stop_codon:yes gene_type:complete
MKKTTHLEEQTQMPQSRPGIAVPSKIARILAHLLTGADINRFEAEHLGDHCLNSTIAVLADPKRHALIFLRRQEKVPNRWGMPCRVTRYSLPPSEHSRALAVLATLKNSARPYREN